MFKSLKSKFVIIVLTIEVFFLALIVTINFSALNNAAHDLTHEKISDISEVFVSFVKDSVINSDMKTVQKSLKNFYEIKDVAALRMLNKQNNVLMEKFDEKKLDKAFMEKLFKTKEDDLTFNKNIFHHIVVDIKDQGQLQGVLHVAVDITDVVHDIKDSRIITLILVALFLFVSFFTAEFVANYVGSALNHLSNVVEHIVRGDTFDISVKKHSTGEMKDLYANMSILQKNIRDRDLQLEQTLNSLQQIMYALDESAIVSKTDTKGVITFVNDRFVQTSGFMSNELIGKSHRLVRHPDNSDAFFQQLWQTLKSKKVYKNIIKNRTKNGETYYVDATILPLLNSKGDTKEYIAIRYDVTDLVKAKDEAIQAEKSKDIFLSNISHEIRTPLNAILGFVHLLQKDIEDEKNRSYLKIVEGSSLILMHIINDVLDFSKIQNGKFHIEKSVFHPIEEFSDAIKLFSATSHEKEVELVALIDPLLPSSMQSDLLRIKQILFNFLSNAFKFTPQGGKVQVVIDYDGDKELLNILVQDTGIGIETFQQKKIFDAFEQADTSNTKEFGGIGLGLTIVSQLAKLLEGEVRLESEWGSGSTFSLHLPIKVLSSSQSLSRFDKQIQLALLQKEEKSLYFEAVRFYLEKLNIPYNVKGEEGLTSNEIVVFIPDGKIEKTLAIKGAKAIALLGSMEDKVRLNEEIFTLCAPFGPMDLITILDLCQGGVKSLKKRSSKSNKHYQGKVLIAEDNKTNQQLIAVLLGEYGIDFTITCNGKEVFEEAKEHKYDLIFMDENMPVVSGLDAFKMIRDYELTAELNLTPIVALTANVLVQDKKRFLEAGMNDFLAKPLDINELERVLERFLKRTS